MYKAWLDWTKIRLGEIQDDNERLQTHSTVIDRIERQKNKNKIKICKYIDYMIPLYD